MTDPLNISIPLAGVETDFPLLPEADYQLQITESTVAPNKANEGYNWNLTLVTTAPVAGVDGRPVNVGTKIFMVSALQAKADSTDPQAFIRGLSDTIDAIFGSDKTNRPNFDQAVVTGALGKSVVAHVKIEEYQGRKSNKIARLKKQQPVA